MNTRSLSALLTVAFGCLLLAASCAKPTDSGPTGTGGTTGAGGSSVTCGTGQMNCSGQCKTVATDNQNCGSCGTACGASRTCNNGMCQCAGGLMECSGQCVPNDAQHCGSCNACPNGQVCAGTSCMAMCPSNQMLCGTTCVNNGGDNTISHCGGCNACPSGATACNNGTCGCAAAGQMLCGSSCVDTNTSNTHCGGCNQPCTNGSCVGGSCMATSGTAGTTGGGRGGTTGAAGTMGTAGTTASAGTTGGGGRGGTTGTGGTVAGTPPGWWTSGSLHGCPWTGVDVLNVGSMTMPTDFVTKNDSFATPYCMMGNVGPDPMYRGVTLLGFNLNEPVTGASNQCAYKPADPSALGPPPITLTGNGIAVNFSRTVGSVLRIQVQDDMGGMPDPLGAMHRWCYTITDVQGPVFAPWNKFNTQCWDQKGSTFNPSTNRVSAIVFASPGNLVSNKFGYCIAGFAFGNDVGAAPAYNPSPFPTVAGTIGGPQPSGTDLDFQRVKVTPAGQRPPNGKQYIIQNNNWGTPGSTDQTIMYSGATFTIMSTTGNVTGQGVPASFPSIYIGNNGDTQAANDPPRGSYTTAPGDRLPRSISAIGTAMTTAAYNKMNGDFNAAYDIWLARPPAPTSMYSDALDGFVMVWLYQPSGRYPIGGPNARVSNKSIGGSSYNVFAGPRGSGTNPNRPVISYVLTTPTMSKTFDLKPLLADAAANATSYGVGAIGTDWLVTDIFFGFEVWTGSAASGLGVTNFSVDVQ
jgi:hypothetical protein